MTRRRNRPPSDPYAILGLSRDASAAQIRRARRRLAKRRHPDAGGSDAAMQRINEAAARALAGAAPTAPQRPATRRTPPRPGPQTQRRVRRDHPSFTVEALPVEAFEALLIASAVIGQLGDDDPPYRLEVLLDSPSDTWCRLELVPDGGGSTVSLTLAGDGLAGDDAETLVADVRDRFVAELNELDWSSDGPRPRPPS